MRKRNLILTIIFIFITLIELTGTLIEEVNIEYFVKPLIMIWITVYFLLNAKKKAFRTGVLLAFFFSFLGDFFLMLPRGNSELLFFAGVGGFFLAQVTYVIVFFVNAENDIKGFLIRRPYWVIPLALYLVGIYAFLKPGLEGIMAPIVFLYALSLIGMSLAAINRKDRVGFLSYKFVLAGSIFFVISDSLLAINKFHTAIPYEGLLIMSTYILAQYLIMRGLILEKE